MAASVLFDACVQAWVQVCALLQAVTTATLSLVAKGGPRDRARVKLYQRFMSLELVGAVAGVVDSLLPWQRAAAKDAPRPPLQVRAASESLRR
jgi:hypothetical protein